MVIKNQPQTERFSAQSIVLIIGAVAIAAVQIITAMRAESKIASVEAKAEVIAGHVNSAASASVAKIDALTAQVAALTAALAEEKETAKLLAAQAEPIKRKP